METQRTDDTCTYRIEIRGRIDASDLNAMSPLELEEVFFGLDVTVFSVRTDQSGLIGLLRHLHTRRVVFLSLAILSPVEITGSR